MTLRLASRRGFGTHGYPQTIQTRLSGQTGKMTVEHTWDLLPYSQRMRGVNIALGNPAFATVSASATPAPWAQLWTDWDTTSLQRRLDQAVTLGCNTVRMAGSVLAVTGGYITRAQYLAKWGQFSGWCQDRKLFLYPYLADYYNEGSVLSSTSTLQAEIVAAATYLHTLPDIVALDLVQESDPWLAGAGSSFSVTLYNAVKAVTNLPCTYSQTGTIASSVTSYTDRRDFADLHIYGTSGSQPSDLTTAWTGGLTYPVCFGEFGTNPAGNSAAQVTRLNQILGLFAATGGSGQRVAGALRWTVEDYDTAANQNNHGLFDETGAEKATETVAFRTIPRWYNAT